jgi:hypothetical protein
VGSAGRNKIVFESRNLSPKKSERERERRDWGNRVVPVDTKLKKKRK